MILNGIDFPNQIIEAICENRLVVFAGAGASVGAPTSLPNFEDLAKEIAEGTGETFKKGTACEVFLGALKHNGVDVNQQAAEITSRACMEHNKLHEAIVDLFCNPENTKIVTTNYDQMFEHVFKSRGISVNVYDAPALPLGDDLDGIIHLHGNVNNPRYMVVTDEDFGRAYLIEGYATRFLIKLFESYTVLFIGYSYTDTILRYLTRAMPRNKSFKRYIITEDRKSDWEVLGMTAIYFPKRSFAVMRDGLIKLGTRSKKGFIDWRNQFSDIKNSPPKDMTIDSEVDYCLEDTRRSQLLANCVEGRDWMEVLDRKDVFINCFSKGVILEKDEIWANWLCDKLVGTDDESINKLILRHGNVINEYLADRIIRKICNNSVDDKAFESYVMLLDELIVDSFWIFQLIENAAERRQYRLSFHLFQKLYSIRFIAERQLLNNSEFEFKHFFLGNHYQVQKAWELIGKGVLSANAVDVLIYVKEKLEELHTKYGAVNQVTDNKESWRLSIYDIEGENLHQYEDPLYLLPKIFIDAAIALQEENGSALKEFLLITVKSKSTLLRKACLWAIRQSTVCSAQEKIQVVLGEKLLWRSTCRQQVFLLVADIFNELSVTEKDLLLDCIDRGEDIDKQINAYEIFNWHVWLQRVDPDNVRIQERIKQAVEEYKFMPRKHPELSIEESSVGICEQSPVSEEELLNMEIPEIMDYLHNYEGDGFSGPDRWGFLGTFERCIKADLNWASKVLFALTKEQSVREDTWTRYFEGVRTANFTCKDKIVLCELAVKAIENIPNECVIANCLYDIVREDSCQDDYKAYEEKLLTISDTIWKHRNSVALKMDKIIDKVFNTTTGIILLIWIRMLSNYDTRELPNKYKVLFEKALSNSSIDQDIAICVLAGHYNFFYYRDEDWCVKSFDKILEGTNRKGFVNAWTGMVYFSSRIYRDTADVLAPIYYDAASHINWLSDEVRYRYIELFLTLLIHVIEKPTLRYIPRFYKFAGEEDQIQLIKAIEQRLRSMGKEEKITWWNGWLKHFLENRKKNKPIVLSNGENKAILDLLLELKEVFDEAVEVICVGNTPDDIDAFFWFSLKELHMQIGSSHSMARLLIKLLKTNTVIITGKDDISEIVNSLDDTNEREMKQLQELMLRSNI